MNSATPPISALPAAIVLIVGMGERGGRVVVGLDDHAPFSPRDVDARRHLGRMTLLSAHDPDPPSEIRHTLLDAGRYLAGRVVSRLESMLVHQVATVARERVSHVINDIAANWRRPTETLVAIVADLGEAAVRRNLGPVLSGIEDLADERLRPIFARDREDKNLKILPLLFSPHVPAAGDGPEIAACLRQLLAQVGARPPDLRRVPRLYLVEHVTNFSVLESEDADAVLENTCLFAAEAMSPHAAASTAPQGQQDSNPAGGVLTRILQPDPRSNRQAPLGAFVVARAEPCISRMRQYLACHLALELLTRIRHAVVDVQGVRGRCETELNLAASLDTGLPQGVMDEVKRKVSAMLGPDHSSSPPWYRFKTHVEQLYGPDRGNPAVENDRPEGEDEGWLRGTVDGILSGWRSLMRGTFDGLVERFRADIAAWELGTGDAMGVRDRVRRIVDDELAPPTDLRMEVSVGDLLAPLDGGAASALGPTGRKPTVYSYREASQLVHLLTEQLRDKLKEAVATRDACRIDDDPSLRPLREAHADLMSATRSVPSLPTLIKGSLLFALAFTFLLAPVLYLVGSKLGVQPASMMDLALVRFPYITAGAIAVLVCAVICGLVFVERLRRARAALDALWTARNQVVMGTHGSVLSFFLSRLSHAWHLARVGALVRVSESAQRDLERLRDIDRALLGARDRYAKRLSDIGVVRRADGTDDLSHLFDGMRAPLIWPLFDPSVARAFIEEKGELTDEQASAILGEAEQSARYYSNWRKELPFLDDVPLDDAIGQTVRDRIDWLTTGDVAGAAVKKRLQQFARIHRRSLPSGLPLKNKAGGEAIDGMDVSCDDLVVPHSMQRFIEQADHTAAVVLEESANVSRAYSVQVRVGVNPDLLGWWKDPRESSVAAGVTTKGGVR